MTTTKMTTEKLEELLDELVRPGLREHGGDVALIGLSDDGILRLRMLGKCAGCPGATMTNETLIEGQLMPIIPGLREVVLVHDVSDELLDFARQLMHHGKE